MKDSNFGWRQFIVFISLLFTNVAKADIAKELYYDRDNLSDSGGPMNLSHYVYQDRNDNGDYDIGDIAMSGVFVIVRSEDGKFVAQSQTNGNGFANVKTSLYETKKARIITEGHYQFEVIVPPDWHVTSGNRLQTVFIKKDLQQRTGLHLNEYLEPVGLAPDKWIKGRFPDKGKGEVSLFQNGKLIESKIVAEDEYFRFDVSPGSYRVVAGSHKRDVDVNFAPVFVGGLWPSRVMQGQRLTLEFDDLSDHQLYKIPNGYAGLQWKDVNIIVRDFGAGSNEGYINAVISGDQVAYSTQARSIEFYRQKGFDLEQVYLAQAWQRARGQLTEIYIYRGNELLVKEVIKLSALGPVLYAPNIANVTKVVIRPMNSWQIVMDDLSIYLTKY